MKKGILISGIITAVLYGLGAIAEIIVALMAWSSQSTTEGGATFDVDPNIALGAANLVVGIFLLIAAIFAIICVVKRNSQMSKGHGITLGVFATIFGAYVPGIIFIVDSSKTRE